MTGVSGRRDLPQDCVSEYLLCIYFTGHMPYMEHSSGPFIHPLLPFSKAVASTNT